MNPVHIHDHCLMAMVFAKVQNLYFFSYFDKSTDVKPTVNDFYVIDSGFLHHKVRWDYKMTVNKILHRCHIHEKQLQ